MTPNPLMTLAIGAFGYHEAAQLSRLELALTMAMQCAKERDLSLIQVYSDIYGDVHILVFTDYGGKLMYTDEVELQGDPVAILKARQLIKKGVESKP